MPPRSISSVTRFERRRVGEVDPLETETVAELACEAVEPRLLELGIVIVR